MLYTVLNPHLSDFFAKPLSFVLLKRRALNKYGYIISPDDEENPEFNFLFNNLSSGFIPDKYFNLCPFFLKKLILKAEVARWKKINNINKNIKCYFDVEAIPERNLLFMLCYRNYKHALSVSKTAQQFKNVVAHLTHYYAFPVEYSNLLKDLPNVRIAADADVSENSFFKQYFGWYNKPVLFIPFAVKERFVAKKPFEERENKAIATGTFHLLEHGDVSFGQSDLIRQKSDSIHPIRRKLFEQKDDIGDFVDVYCKPYFEKHMKSNVKQSASSNKLQVSQSQYFSFDIVDKYNQYKFAVIGEELFNGLPGIGSFEAMACGCVLIADPSCYHGLDMKPGVHYLPYDSTIQSLVDVISSNNDLEKLMHISKAASEFIAATMQPKPLKKHVVNLLLKL